MNGSSITLIALAIAFLRFFLFKVLPKFNLLDVIEIFIASLIIFLAPVLIWKFLSLISKNANGQILA
ncbi:MAG: hypothetical protein ABIF12_02305 [bacterium]